MRWLERESAGEPVQIATESADRKKLAGAILAGIGLGMWLGWRRRR
jgi:hypothetical protein